MREMSYDRGMYSYASKRQNDSLEVEMAGRVIPKWEKAGLSLGWFSLGRCLFYDQRSRRLPILNAIMKLCTTLHVHYCLLPTRCRLHRGTC